MAGATITAGVIIVTGAIIVDGAIVTGAITAIGKPSVLEEAASVWRLFPLREASLAGVARF